MYSVNEDPANVGDALPNIVFYSGEHYLNVCRTLGQNLNFLEKRPDNTIAIENPEGKKIFFIRAEISIAHILNDTIYTMVIYNKAFPDHKIVLAVPFSADFIYRPHDGQRASFIQNESVWDFIENIAIDRNIDLQVLHFPDCDDANISIRDFYAVNAIPHGTLIHANRLGLRELRKASITAARSAPSLGKKKIYVSRTKTIPRQADSFQEQEIDSAGVSRINDDNRVNDEQSLSDAFEELGFEIVHVQELETYEQQVKMFSEASVIAGVTGAGLNNMTFMPEGSTVIEVTTPIWSVTNVSLHNFYKNMANYLDHFYLSIPAITDRSGEKIAKNISSHVALRNFLKGL